MKITILTPAPGEEDEIIVRCTHLDERIMKLISSLKADSQRISAYGEGVITMLSPRDIYYFEAVDNKVFAYCEKTVFEVRRKLYELEADFSYMDFLRISKSTIINVAKIQHLSSTLNGRLEARLRNGEKVIISRQYVADLKKMLGI